MAEKLKDETMSHIHHECELERYIVGQLEGAGWLVGKSADYDQGRALIPEDVVGWLDDSQQVAMAKIVALNGVGARDVVLDRLVKQLENKVDGGTVNVLRH